LNNRLIAQFLVLFGATVLVSSAHAQGHVSFVFASESRGGATFSRGGVSRSFAHARRARRYFGGSTFAPYFYPDYDSETGTMDAAPAQFNVQSAPSASPAAVLKPSPSLVIELQGDHWVRLTNYGQSQGGQFIEPESERASDLTRDTLRRVQAPEPHSELPSAVLVFRDGHKEEIGKYVIVGKIIFTSADYWSSGSWTRKVPIGALDVPATLKVNQERGAKFSLPSGPNEVMIRP
jgi:hypothetical protein